MDTLRFKFKWLDNQGNAAGILSKRGSFDGKTLVLDDVQLPAACLTTVESRGNRFVIATVDREGKVLQALFNLTSGSPDRLRAALGLCRSRTWAEAHREELAKAGKAHEFRSAVCPHCQATIDLTSMPSSPQVSSPVAACCTAAATASAEASMPMTRPGLRLVVSQVQQGSDSCQAGIRCPAEPARAVGRRESDAALGLA